MYAILRLCHNDNIECMVFNLMEVCTWLNGEKWNILWAEDESWLPEETTVVMGASLPHGFHKVIPRECDGFYLQAWLNIAGYGGFYPFAAEVGRGMGSPIPSALRGSVDLRGSQGS